MLHAAILLDSANGMSDNAVAVANGVNRHTVALCVRKFLQFGIDAALGELPRPGKRRRIPDDAIAWVLHCACQKPKDIGYSYELWTYALLQMFRSGPVGQRRGCQLDPLNHAATSSSS